MREKLNESKAAQIGLVAVLVVVAAVFFLKSSGGGEEGGEVEETTVTVESGGETLSISAPTSALEAAPTGMAELPTSLPAAAPLPQSFIAAYEADETVALLDVHDGGIDDRYTARALRAVAAVEDVAPIVVPARQISRYASITVALDVSQLPALIVMRPKSLSHGVPQASVAYGYQTPQSIHQLIADAAYKGPEGGTYHPG